MKKIKGFTLIELLIAITIFAIVAVALYSSFYSGIRILRRSDEAMKFHQDLRLATGEISLDLRNSLLTPIYEAEERTLASEEEEEKEEPIYFFIGDAKKFTFVTLKDIYDGGKMRREICDVTYYFQAGKNKGLMRTIKFQGKGYTVKPGGGEVLITNIRDMKVQYSYEGEEEDSEPIWLDEWEQESKIPLGVKIKLKLKGAGRLKDFTKTIFIPVGALGVEEESET